MHSDNEEENERKESKWEKSGDLETGGECLLIESSFIDNLSIRSCLHTKEMWNKECESRTSAQTRSNTPDWLAFAVHRARTMASETKRNGGTYMRRSEVSTTSRDTLLHLRLFSTGFYTGLSTPSRRDSLDDELLTDVGIMRRLIDRKEWINSLLRIDRNRCFFLITKTVIKYFF